MNSPGQVALKTLALAVAILFLVGAVAASAFTFLFGTKVSPLFKGPTGELAEASEPVRRRLADFAADGGSDLDAGVAPPRFLPPTRSGAFLPATKSGGFLPAGDEDPGAGPP